jgi:GDP-4-dehydro-6-deoxy-D-mannose reductase
MQTIVTGSGGFVGRHLVDFLRRRGHNVIGVDQTPARHAADVSMNLMDCRAVSDLFVTVRPDRVFHLAGLTFEPVDAEGFDQLGQANVMAMASVIEGCTLLNRNFEYKPRLIFASSCAVYGVPTSADGRVTTKDPACPVLKYGWSKLAAEELAICAARRGQIEAVCARSFNIIGPGESSGSVIGAVVSQLMSGEKVIKVGDVTTIRDFVDVRDVVAALILMGAEGRNMGIYNVGSGKGTIVGNVIAEVIAASGLKVDLEFCAARTRPVDVPAIYADISDLVAIGWKPQYSISQTVADILLSAGCQPGESS